MTVPETRQPGDGDAPAPSHAKPSTQPAGFFYWQLAAKDQARLRAANSILVDEGYLAHDINWGRRLLDVRADPDVQPDVDAQWAGPPSVDHVSDAVSAILQAAVEMGLDPESVCARALSTHRGVRRGACEAVRRG